MWLLICLGLPSILGVSVLLLKRMPVSSTEMSVKVDVGIAWVVSLSILLLVPADIADTIYLYPHGFETQTVKTSAVTKFLAVAWQVLYWYAFAALITILPFHQEYADCGEFRAWDKVKWSLKQNALFYSGVIIAGIVGALILLASHKFTIDGLLGFAIATSNAFGLMLVLLLLGYGLVEVPRVLWRKASSKGRQRLTFHKVGVQAELTKKMHQQLCVAIATVQEVSKHFSRRDPLRKYMDKIEDMIDLELEAESSNAQVTVRDKDLEFEYADIHELGMLRRQLRKAQESFRRELSRYEVLVKSTFTNDEPSLLESREKEFFESAREDAGSNHLWTLKAKDQYRKFVLPILLRVSSIVLGICSVCVVLSQLTIYEKLPMWLKNLSPLPAVIQAMKPNTAMIQLTCLLLLGYLISAAWLSLFKLRLFSFYVMVPYHTPSSSLIMNAMLMCRFAAPLAFNFMMIAMPPTTDDNVDVRQTTFYSEFGEKMLDLSYLGNFLGIFSLTFTTFAPTIMVPYMLLVTFNRFDLFTKMCSLCGCESKLNFEDDWEDSSGYYDLGHRLVAVEYENYTSGLRVGLGIRQYFQESNQSVSIWGRLLSRGKASNTNGGGLVNNVKGWLNLNNKQSKDTRLYQPVRRTYRGDVEDSDSSRYSTPVKIHKQGRDMTDDNSSDSSYETATGASTTTTPYGKSPARFQTPNKSSTVSEELDSIFQAFNSK